MSKSPKYNHEPPRLATRFLRWYCRRDLMDEVEGDLYELFQRRVDDQGVWKAKVLYCFNVLLFLHPDHIRKRKESSTSNHTAMFKNHFLISIRNLLKNRVYSFINIAGLSIGICCSILILLWVFDEASYDKFLPKSERLYQVWLQARWEEDLDSQTSLPLPTYEALKTANSHIQRVAVSDYNENHLLSVNDKPLIKDGFYASKEFLEMFQFPLLQGSASNALNDPSSVVITQSTARALFDKEDPLGKIVRVDDAHDLKVTAVLEDIPTNSSFQFDFLLPWKLNEQNDFIKESQNQWQNHSFQIYAELDNAEQKEAVENSIRDLVEKNGNMDVERELFLYPLLRWRLHSNFENGVEEGGLNDYVQLFTIIAIFILIIACINFMNLSTARSERRAKEVGIRKSMGSKRGELIRQFMGESLFITTLAFMVALLLTELALPFYNGLVDKALTIDYTSWRFWLVSIGGIIFTGTIAGSYPAFYLSSFQPVKVLKGKITTGKSASTPRKVLVTLQFGFSILLIIGTLVIHQQIQLLQGRTLGYQQENLINVGFTEDIKKNYDVLKHELLQSGVVESVTRTNSPITDVYYSDFLGWPGQSEDQRVIFNGIAADYDYTKTMGIEILEGRDFSKDFASDSSAILINKAALDVMGLDDPIGTQLEIFGGKRTLIGVVDNVLMGSPHRPIDPMFVVLADFDNSVSIRLSQTDDLTASLAQVEGVFKQYNSEYPFDYQFADVEFQKKFTTIIMTRRLANLFAILTIIITGLGLFGLASYTAEQRTKEIGIRKVLGASVLSIVSIMSKDFSRLVIISFLVSAPLAWWLLNMYLERYPIRTEVAWWVFPVTGFFALVFALVVVTIHSLKAANANPVNSLRNE